MTEEHEIQIINTYAAKWTIAGWFIGLLQLACAGSPGPRRRGDRMTRRTSSAQGQTRSSGRALFLARDNGRFIWGYTYDDGSIGFIDY